jgi:phosphatidylglycerophosphate synthase
MVGGSVAGTGVHVREHLAVTAALEKRVLVWLAQRMPARMNSDHLTIIGALGMVGAAAAFAAAGWNRAALLLVPVFLAVNWFGDSLDGTLARVRGHQRPRYGYYVDHVVDLFNATVLFAGMAVSGLMHPLLALALLVGYLLLCAESFLATHAVGVFRISFSGFGPTELRILLSAGALFAIDRPLVHPFGLVEQRLFDVGGLVAVVGMAAVFVISALRNTRTLYVAEPLPSRAVREASHADAA